MHMAIDIGLKMEPVAGSKALTPAQNDAVREWTRELLKQYEGNQTLLAPKLGLSQPTLSSFLNGRSGTSYGTVERLAKLLGKSEQEILGKRGGSTAPRHDRRALAAELAREDGVLEEAIASVLDQPPQPGDEKLSTVRWVDRIRSAELEILRQRRVDERAAPDESGARRLPDAPVAVKRKPARR